MNTTPSPASIDAEQALLGQMLTDPRVVDEVAALDPSVFYRPDHGRLFAVIVSLRMRGVRPDLVAVADAVREAPDTYGGLAYIMQLPDRAPSTANAAHYMGIIRAHAKRRAALRALDELRAVLHTDEPPDAVLTRASGLLEQIAVPPPDAAMWTMSDAMGEAAEATRPGQVIARPRWGLAGLDEHLIGGQIPGNLTVIGGRPSGGKTALALHILRAAVTSADGPFGAHLISMEMDRQELAERYTACLSGMTYGQIVERRGIDYAEWYDAVDLARSEGAMTIDDTPMQNLRGLIASIRAAKRTHARRGEPLRVVVIDYLQMMDHEVQRGQTLAAAMNTTLYALKAEARRSQVHVILLSQLNRNKGDNERPANEDLRDSGAIEQAANRILMIWQEDPESDERVITITKNRNGRRGVDVRTTFIGKHQRFIDRNGDIRW